jgi:hypothetical protein
MMEVDLVEEFWDSIDVIEAGDQLAGLKIADFPNLKNNDRQKLHKDIFRRAQPLSFEHKKTITWDEMAKMLNGR